MRPWHSPRTHTRTACCCPREGGGCPQGPSGAQGDAQARIDHAPSCRQVGVRRARRQDQGARSPGVAPRRRQGEGPSHHGGDRHRRHPPSAWSRASSSARRCSHAFVLTASVLVTLSGLPGSGTSTVALVAASLGLAHIDGGTVFRPLAAERGLSLAEFAEVRRGRRRHRQRPRPPPHRAGRRGRRAARVAPGGLARTRAGLPGCASGSPATRRNGRPARACRDGHPSDEALVDNREREASEHERYLDYYGIDLADRDDLRPGARLHRAPAGGSGRPDGGGRAVRCA